ncbi:lipase family protein [Rhodococcus tibetensis]|uniref:Lipase family protein n=1 Tax=Rhodococcus tibetensis TaxID=2965064 RepID=A0ABT1QFA8_9NOCA|nr:lipase family protein [Rhodococcus sp. FXJ9.536]MCQ4120892.1 lipase family protein [Rhodococcus sp. FXJ9.536]
MPIPSDATGPGAVLRAVEIPTIDRRIVKLAALTARVTYLSTSGVDGSITEVSGSVFAPQGNAPEDGWPIIALAHGTTGIQQECAPSKDSQLLGSSLLVSEFLRRGYVVAVPDYQGLGGPGFHPYLDPTTEGYNVIDAVRASRQMIPDTSDRWLGFGYSQGGQASWAANELAREYGQGLNLVGTVAMSPLANLRGLADAAATGTLTTEQVLVLQWVLATLERSHPGLDLDEYRRGVVAQNWDVLLSCSGPTAETRARIATTVSADDLRPATPEALGRLRELLDAMSLPKGIAAAPMLIGYGGMDSFMRPESTARAIAEACAKGAVVDVIFDPAKGHGGMDMGPVMPWIEARFAGQPAPNTCEQS